jgi:hypothetical protein
MPSFQALNIISSQSPRVQRYVIGVDLASQQDYTAITVNEVSRRPSDRNLSHAVVHLDRWRGLTYPQTVARILEQYSNVRDAPELTLHSPVLVVDSTGVGLPVLHMLREQHRAAVGVMIHSGDTVTRGDANVYRVPKRDLVSHLQLTLQSRRLRIARELSLSHVLAEELRGFRVSIGLTGHDRYGNEVGDAMWREQEHDDLVLAAALAVWYAETRPAPLTEAQKRRLAPW